MSWITKIALKKRWLTLLLAAVVAGASIWATLTLKMELIPDIELPITTVITVYPQAQPEEVMNRVTIPIEGVIADIDGLKHINSTSMENSSVVFAEFEYGTDMKAVNSVIAESLSELDLPQAVRDLPMMMPELGENPRLFSININLLPVVSLSLNGDMAVGELREIATTQIMPQLEAIEGINSVTVEGGDSDKIIVSPSLEKMNQSGVSMTQLAGALAMQQYQSLNDIENVLINLEGLRLSSVAEVELGLAPGSSISRTNGKPSINISIMKDKEANTVTTANAVLKKAAEIELTLPSGLGLITVLDQSLYIENSISDLTLSAIIGSVLAIVVVFLFLMAFRASLITAISIPLSLLVGFLVMRFTSITINILTLSAMVIAVGRVIDNSIVILEVIFRHMQQGESFIEAAINGTKEVVTPITSATIATIVIFVPLVFVGGMIGEMFIPFALTITFALVASLLVALTVVPALSGFLVARKNDNQVKASWYLNIYTSMLQWCLSHRVLSLVIAVLLFLGSIGLLPIVGTTFMPEMNMNVITVEIEMPAGTDLASTSELAGKVENVLAANPDVITYNTVIGSSGSGTGGFAAMLGGGGSNTASISIIIDPDSNLAEVTDRVRSDLDGLTELGKINVVSQQAMVSGMVSDLEISVRGQNQEDIILTATQLASELNSLADVADVEIQFGGTYPRLIIEPDVAKLMALGLSPEQMAQLQPEFLFITWGGVVAQTVLDDAPYDIFVEGIIKDIDNVDMVKALMIGAPVPMALGDIATVEIGQQVSNIKRYDQKLSASITGSITKENVGAVNRQISARIDSLTLPAGVDISMGGMSEEMSESFSAMFLAIGVAVLLVYVVLVITFRSFRNPLIIMVSLPLASIGAVVGLLITGHPLGVTGLLGILMLIGIVLTNAVVLVAVVEQFRKGGLSVNDSLVAGGQTRLRPILMTAITTMIAMLPLALGFGQGLILAAEMATVVIGGLFTSTFLTLLVIPVLYSLMKRQPRHG